MRKKLLKKDIINENRPKRKYTRKKPLIEKDVTKGVIRRGRKSTKNNYINADEMNVEIKEFYKTGNISDNLGKMIYNIANGMSFSPSFMNYTYVEEMKGDALNKMFSALRHKKYDPSKGFNPFSYFNVISYNAFCNRLKKEKKMKKILDEYVDDYKNICKSLGMDIKDNRENTSLKDDE